MRLRESRRGLAWAIGIATLGALYPNGARAAILEPRLGADLGVWAGNFAEAYGSDSSSTPLDPATGIGLILGVYVPALPIFLDWCPTYFIPGAFNKKPTSSAYYLGMASFEAGFSFVKSPLELPFDLALGFENGIFAFTNGAKTHLSGNVLRVSMNILPGGADAKLYPGIRLEYRRAFFNFDTAGSIPVDTTTNLYFVGFVFLFSP